MSLPVVGGVALTAAMGVAGGLRVRVAVGEGVMVGDCAKAPTWDRKSAPTATLDAQTSARNIELLRLPYLNVETPERGGG